MLLKMLDELKNTNDLNQLISKFNDSTQKEQKEFFKRLNEMQKDFNIEIERRPIKKFVCSLFTH